ncbi:terpene synthase metal-binding domain-containing protein [Aspergillus piperis CBS 112811]|uniref:Terpene synthase n=1 Tax=Aspergillus piperis CBS 112811 TaxID=1448313 RepID=A0A8G1R7U0_9EURO|nr:terpene synthase metal-binding domain-containing protein [Aspergillus piperis CBS 112811]RAH61168.1 terpene synthase metal-binding domain-containing protein [Aspergillus piperis CBS 112811]
MDRHNLEAQLGTIKVPIVHIPWAGDSADVLLLEASMLDWADQKGLLVDVAYRERVKRSRYAWLAARCHPKAAPELLSVISKFFVWLFVVDDLFLDRVDIVTPNTLSNLTAIINVVNFNCARPEPVYGELALLDICQSLRQLLSAEHFERFAQGIKLWATTAGLGILYHLQERPVGVSQYESIRRHTSGVESCLALADASNCGPISSDEFYRLNVQELRRYTNNIVCLANDIHSSIVESRQPGHFWNMVHIRAADGYTLQESLDHTVASVYEELERFQKLEHHILQDATPQLCGLVNGCKQWIRGYVDWVALDTKRYQAAYAVGDADDRNVLHARHMRALFATPSG